MSETKILTFRPNYVAILRDFGRDAVNQLTRLAESKCERISYEDFYSFLFSVRMAISALDSTDNESKRAYAVFVEQYDRAATKAFQRLNELRAEAEEHENDPF